MFGIGRRKTQGQLARAELNQGIGHLRQAATHAAKGAGATVGPRVQAARSAVVPTAMLVQGRASSGVASTVAALAPLVTAMRTGRAEATVKAMKNRKAAAKQAAISKRVEAKNMKAAKKKQRSPGMMTGLLAAGIVAGLAGAMAMRRRREQQEWTEYDPTATLGPTREDTLEPLREDVDTIVVETPDPARSSSQPVIQPTDKVPSVAESARDVSGGPADDVTTALTNGKNTAKASGRR